MVPTEPSREGWKRKVGARDSGSSNSSTLGLMHAKHDPHWWPPQFRSAVCERPNPLCADYQKESSRRDDTAGQQYYIDRERPELLALRLLVASTV